MFLSTYVMSEIPGNVIDPSIIWVIDDVIWKIIASDPW